MSTREKWSSVIVLNDQGGGVMNVSRDVVGTLRAQDHGHPPLIFDARGNGGGAISPTITGDHQDRITDYTAIVVRRDSMNFSFQAIGQYKQSEQASSIKQRDHKDATDLVMTGGGDGNG